MAKRQVNTVERRIELYFVHGWGCDSNIWQKWLPAISKDVSYHIFDRGYFGRAKSNICLNKTNSTKILISHSFGLHLIPPESLQDIDLLVLISSFRYFHEQTSNGKLSGKSIKLMKQRLAQDPLALLQDFYLKCGLNNTKPPSFSTINHQLLMDDLLLLDTHQVDLGQLRKIPEIILLHGACDQIVSIEHSQLMHKQLPNSQLFISDHAEHGLPVTLAKWCMQIIDNNKNGFAENIFNHTANDLAYAPITCNFARRAVSYDQAAHAQKYAANRLASRIARQFSSSSPGSVLEIGCGTGLLSQHLRNLLPEHKIYLLDPAQDMLSLCRKNLGQSSECQFIHSTIEDYFNCPEFSQTRHTLIASSFVLHWLFDFKLVLNRLLEQLAPAGQLFFSFPTIGSFPQWQNVCAQLNIPFTVNQLPGLEDIKSAIATGKANIDCEEYTCNINFENSLQFFQHIKMLGANTNKFTADRQLTISDFRSLLETWDKHQSAALGKSDHKITCTYKILEGTITRR